jgi:thiamine biosynthesis lipoprotein
MADGPQSKPPTRWLPFVVVLLLLAAIIAFMTRPKVRLGEMAGETMGTTYSVKIVTAGWGFGPREQDALARDVAACLEDVNARMSTYRTDSELSRFNAHADGSPFAFSVETFHVFQRSMEISALTGGAFDITVGPIVNAYGFGPESRPVEPPSDVKLNELRQRVGYRLVQLDHATRSARKLRPDVYCDLSAIAKGYGVDRVAELLDRRGIANYMVEVGGEVRVRGRNHLGQPWRIGIEKPTDQGRAIHRAIGLTDKALATSGDYRNYYMADGKRISHEIDPRNGRAVRNRLAAVSVIADDCETADALATALMVLGPVDGYNLAEQNRIAALFLVRVDGEPIEELATNSFCRLVPDACASRPADDRPVSP